MLICRALILEPLVLPIKFDVSKPLSPKVGGASDVLDIEVDVPRLPSKFCESFPSPVIM